ncbi:MAG TPA: GxxExxY protein [Burkholderiales bacterium]|nr:GxxExxY protein [Burkholderiales bacterium]
MNENKIGDIVLGGAMKVHSALGPGLLESAYEICLAHEIIKQGLSIKQQVLLPVHYDGLKLDAGYRLDLLVHNKVIVELKAVEKLLPIHTAQLLSYLKLSQLALGYLLNCGSHARRHQACG